MNGHWSGFNVSLVTAALVVVGTLAWNAMPAVGQTGGEENQKCPATSVCTAVAPTNGPCLAGQSACCCRIAPSAVHTCECRDADTCQTPGGGNHCDDGMTID
jgi:hypothetical protein